MYDRGERVGEQLQQEIAALLREVKDPGVQGLITVTDLKLSKDRKSAVVFYSVLGTKAQRESTEKSLPRVAPFLRHQLREKLRLKVIPRIAFEYDPTPERAQRIEKILSDLEREQGGGPGSRA